jgi:hypothetical protein
VRPSTYHTYTQAELDYIKAHCNDKAYNVHQVVGGRYATVQRYMEQFRNGTFKRTKGSPHYYYALYLSKTDELVCSGSARECMEQLGISKNAFHTLVCRSRNGEIKKWDVYIEPYKDSIEQ